MGPPRERPPRHRGLAPHREADRRGRRVLRVLAATPEAFVLPDGEPADQATVDEITATVRTVLACFNAGNFLAYFALSSDDMVLADLEEEGITADMIGFLGATPEATDEATWSTLVGCAR